MDLRKQIIIIIVLFVLLIFALIWGNRKQRQIKRYKRINLGMSENEMLSIMHGGYSKSLLKKNRIKYEWRTRTSTGVCKVDIYVKDGFVEEVKPYNV